MASQKCSAIDIRNAVTYGRGLQKKIDLARMYDRLAYFAEQEVQQLERLYKRRDRSRPFKRSINRLRSAMNKFDDLATKVEEQFESRYGDVKANGTDRRSAQHRLPKRRWSGEPKMRGKKD